MTRVLVVLRPGVHLLDVAGPAQVFHGAADRGASYRLEFVAAEPTVTSAQGLELAAAAAWADPGPGDLVLVAGWRVAARFTGPPLPPPLLDLLRSHHARGGRVASICAGADALGAAGLLDGRRCTTHHQLQDSLAARYPAARVVRDVLYTVDGPVLTSAGLASGIDLALAVVASDHGPGLAARVARNMVIYARRNGHDTQDSVLLRYRNHTADAVHRAQDHIDAHFREPIALDELGTRVGLSGRHLARLFRAATGVTPLRYQQSLRVERARHLLGAGATQERAAHEVGFSSPRMLRRLLAAPGG